MAALKIHKLILIIGLSTMVLIGIGTWIGMHYAVSDRSTNLSSLTVNHQKIGDNLDKDEYIVDEAMITKKFSAYYKKEYPDLIFIVKKKSSEIVGITLIHDRGIRTNFNATIEGPIENVIDKLGRNYKEKQLHNGFKSINFLDKDNKIKLSIICKHDKIKRIELYKK
ncbi:hypothetical protein AST12_12300 [Staphylococcus succinus]|nr:hypothetical protein AST12_12300 [Staphylococcus succinus]